MSTHLPAPPARVLEIGCGRGELAARLADAGYDVTAIDPDAPAGPIFRRTTLEELPEGERYDAVVARRSLHHIHDLAAAVEKLARLLRPGGVVVIDEFAWEELDAPTAAWLCERRGGASGGRRPLSVDQVLREWRREHEDLHTSSSMRAALAQRFAEQLSERVPYLARSERTEYLPRPQDDAEGEREERELIAAGRIRACGWRWVGTA